MRKSILVMGTVLVTFSLTAIGYFHWEASDIPSQMDTCSAPSIIHEKIFEAYIKPPAAEVILGVEPRFNTTATKELLRNAETIADILPGKATKDLISYTSVQVAILTKDGEIIEWGKDEHLNKAQLNLLRSADYSTNFYIRADSQIKNPKTGEIEFYDLVYYMTIVPEMHAEYTIGMDGLLSYLRENSKEETSAVDKKDVKPGQISFDVAPNGKVKNIEVTSSSGYEMLDNRLYELLTQLPETWSPATNEKGEAVTQRLVLFYGIQGC